MTTILSNKKIALIALLFLATARTLAESSDTASTSFVQNVVNAAETVLDALTIERDTWQLALYPAASYSHRTGLALGIMPSLQLKNSRAQPTTITPSVLISTHKMFEIQCDANVYFRKNRNLDAKAEFFYLPDDYYGPGNVAQDGNAKKNVLAEYKFCSYTFNADINQEFECGLQIGIAADFAFHRFKDIEARDDTYINSILSDEGWSNALGLVLGYDTRDDVIFPRKGWYARLKTLIYTHLLGSHANFTAVTLDARRYVAIGQQSTFAMQFYANSVGQNAPFYKMSTCGGTRLGRAIGHNLKYIDRYAWLMQTELRVPIYWRIGATAFAALGNVQHTLATDILNNSHAMLGCGLRLKIFSDKGLNLRLDGGISSRGDKAIYYNIREAF